MIAEDYVRFAHSGPSKRFLRGLRPLVSVRPLPLSASAGGHASAITTTLPNQIIRIWLTLFFYKKEADPIGSVSSLNHNL